jgi:hypothetical protein
VSNEAKRFYIMPSRHVFHLGQFYSRAHTVKYKAMAVGNHWRKKTNNRTGLQAKVFAETTSAHGFGFLLTSSDWLGRTVWLSLILTGGVLSVVFTVRICIRSFQPPFYSTDLSIVAANSDTAPAPDIVVCDPSPWDFDKAEKLNISLQQLSYTAQLLYPLFSVDSRITANIIKEMDDDHRRLLQRFDNNPINLLDNVTKSCSQVIVYCILPSKVVYDGQKCCRLFFPNVEYTLTYKCYSSGGKLDYHMSENSQVSGITVHARVTSQKRQLNHVAKTSMKLLQPGTFNVLPVEKRETDSSDKASFFQHYEASKSGLFKMYLSSNS